MNKSSDNIFNECLYSEKHRLLKQYFDRYWSNECAKRREIHDFRKLFQYAGISLSCLTGDIKGKSILEIGPGQGNDSIALKELGAKVFALDISLKSLESVKSISRQDKGKSTVFPVSGVAEFICFKNEAFHGVFLKTVLMHVDLTRLKNEIQRILKPQGFVIILEPLKYNPFVTCYRKFFSIGRFSPHSYIGFRALKSLKQGFRSEKVDYHFLFTPLLLPFIKYIDHRIIIKLLNIEDKIFKNFIFFKRFAWFLELKLIKY